MHNLGQGHELSFGIRPVCKISDRALLHRGRHIGESRCDLRNERTVVCHSVHRRDIDAGDLRQLPQHFSARTIGTTGALPFAHELSDLANDLLAVAQHDKVDEIGDGFGVVGAMTTHADQRIGVCTGSRVNRNACEVNAVEEVRVCQFSAEVEGNDIEIAGRTMCVHREQLDLLSSQQRFKVSPRRIGAFGCSILTLIENLVENLQTLIRQTDLVGVRLRQQPTDDPATVSWRLHSQLTTDVTGRLLDLREQVLEARP